MTKVVFALPQGRLRRSAIEWATREALVGTFNRRDFGPLPAFLTEDFEGHPSPPLAVVLGHDGEGAMNGDEFQALLREWVANWGQFSMEAKEIVDLGDGIVVLHHMTGHGAGSGVEIREQPEAQLYEFRGGRCMRWRQYWNWEEALEAAGLSRPA
jgi:hypothetical protein